MGRRSHFITTSRKRHKEKCPVVPHLSLSVNIEIAKAEHTAMAWPHVKVIMI